MTEDDEKKLLKYVKSTSTNTTIIAWIMLLGVVVGFVSMFV